MRGRLQGRVEIPKHELPDSIKRENPEEYEKLPPIYSARNLFSNKGYLVVNSTGIIALFKKLLSSETISWTWHELWEKKGNLEIKEGLLRAKLVLRCGRISGPGDYILEIDRLEKDKARKFFAYYNGNFSKFLRSVEQGRSILKVE